ncbi:MAG: hypothetical protein C6I00_05910 [Nitratiruptor sp.]|nr:hypothetical protein [Nitratiruptor sp.]NPA83636.1 hypothetical protein [Campylobacterota bacterium]
MGQIVLLAFLVVQLWSDTIFDRRCVTCHREVALPLKPIFFDYLLHFSSERLVKGAMARQLLNPDPKNSLIPKERRRGYRHQVDPDELDLLLQIYWNRYKVIGRIR